MSEYVEKESDNEYVGEVVSAPQSQRQKIQATIESLTNQLNNAKFSMTEAERLVEMHKHTAAQAEGALMMAQEFLKDFPEENKG